VEEGPKARRALTVLVACEAIAVVALHRLGGVDGFAIPRHDLVLWLQQTPSEDVLLAGVRLAALVAAWWLLGSTLLYVAARAAHLHRTATALGWATLPAVRRWADRAAAVSIVAASTLGAARPAAADPPPTTPAVAPVIVDADHRDRSTLPDLPPASVRTGRSVEPQPAPSAPTIDITPSPPSPTAPIVPPTTTPPAPVMPPASATPAPAPRMGATHTVAPGEHLWSIAATHIATSTGRATRHLTAAEIAPYWSRLVDMNRQRLRSGNQNLVYPGEVLDLPPL
jgi:hypothetical protein